MQVEYVRVYRLDGKGTVKLGELTLPESGKFGVLMDNTAENTALNTAPNTAVTNNPVAGTSCDIFLWASDLPASTGW